MSYTPTTWQAGDVVTSAGMNNMEQGILDAQNALFTVIMTRVNVEGSSIFDHYTFDHTMAEIYEAFDNGATLNFVIMSGKRLINTVNSGPEPIIVTPVISTLEDAGLLGVVLYRGQYPAYDHFNPRYILITDQKESDYYNVPMMDNNNTIGFNRINEIIDFGPTIEQFLLGAYQLAQSNGTATLTTGIDDANTVEITDGIMILLRDVIYNGRGTHFTVESLGITYHLNLSSFYASPTGHDSTITMSIDIAEISAAGSTLSNAAIATGKLTLQVKRELVDEVLEPVLVIGIIDLTYRTATVV